MPARRIPITIAAALLAGLFVFPFLTRSASCDSRLTAHLLAGIVVFAPVVLVPFVLPGGRSVAARFVLALVFAALCAVVWVAALVAGDVKIVCRLF